MTVAEAKETYAGQYDEVEIYRFIGSNYHIHTDTIKWVDEESVNDDSEVVAYELMDEEMYNRTILANTDERFADGYDADVKILVICVK